MRIIFANGTYIKPDDDSEPQYNSVADNNYIWGHRWNKNEAAWGKFCTLFLFDEWKWVDDSELPMIKPLDISTQAK